MFALSTEVRLPALARQLEAAQQRAISCSGRRGVDRLASLRRHARLLGSRSRCPRQLAHDGQVDTVEHLGRSARRNQLGTVHTGRRSHRHRAPCGARARASPGRTRVTPARPISPPTAPSRPRRPPARARELAAAAAHPSRRLQRRDRPVVNSSVKPCRGATVWRTATASAATSGPMPSPGKTATVARVATLSRPLPRSGRRQPVHLTLPPPGSSRSGGRSRRGRLHRSRGRHHRAAAAGGPCPSRRGSACSPSDRDRLIVGAEGGRQPRRRLAWIELAVATQLRKKIARRIGNDRSTPAAPRAMGACSRDDRSRSSSPRR